jgi:hypothetical protein
VEALHAINLGLRAVVQVQQSRLGFNHDRWFALVDECIERIAQFLEAGVSSMLIVVLAGAGGSGSVSSAMLNATRKRKSISSSTRSARIGATARRFSLT